MKNRSALVLIFLTVFIDLLGFGILIPILPSFSVKELNIDEKDKYVVLRYVAWQATHDIGQSGINLKNKIESIITYPV